MLKLEVGKYYENNLGHVFKIDANTCNMYPFIGTSPDYEHFMSFMGDGRHRMGMASPTDLVVEVPNPSSLPTSKIVPTAGITPTIAGQMHFVESVYYFTKPKDYSLEMCVDHSAVDTGMVNSWCKHCDINMEFNRDTGKYRVKV